MDKEPVDKNAMLELYKFHAELYDRLHQRRYNISRTYIALLTAITAFTVVALRFPVDPMTPTYGVLIMAGGLGLVLSLTWLLQLKTHDLFISLKHNVLKEAESKMSLPFFSREEELLGEHRKEYTRISSFSDNNLPTLFFVFSLVPFLQGVIGMIRAFMGS